MPLWQRKSGPGRVRMLDYRLPSGETLHELVAGSYRIEDEALAWSPDPGDACAVLGRLREDVRRVAQAFALGGGSWAEAAATAGLPPQVGERVMRKLRRLDLKYQHPRPLVGVACTQRSRWSGRCCPFLGGLSAGLLLTVGLGLPADERLRISPGKKMAAPQADLAGMPAAASVHAASRPRETVHRS